MHTGADSLPRLAPARAAVWQDLVFVNLAENAPPLLEHLAPMIARLDGYDLSELRYAGHIACDVKANWKLIHENYMETYHVFAVHPALAKFVPMSDRRPTEFDGDCIYNEYRFAAPEDGRGQGLPYYPGLSDDFKNRGVWFHFFPTLDLELWAYLPSRDERVQASDDLHTTIDKALREAGIEVAVPKRDIVVHAESPEECMRSPGGEAVRRAPVQG